MPKRAAIPESISSHCSVPFPFSRFVVSNASVGGFEMKMIMTNNPKHPRSFRVSRCTARSLLLGLGFLLLAGPLRGIETTTISETIEWSIGGIGDSSIKMQNRTDSASGSTVYYFAPVRMGEEVTVTVTTRPNQETNDMREILIAVPDKGTFYTTSLRWSRYAGPSSTWHLPPPPIMAVALQSRYSPFQQEPAMDPRYQGDKWIHIQYAEFTIQDGVTIHHIYIIPTTLYGLSASAIRKGLPKIDKADITTHRKKPYGCAGCSAIGLPGFHVNTGTLLPVIEDTLYAHGGLGPEVKLRLTYNPDPADRTAFGPGWRLNYDSFARATLRGAEVIRGDGALLPFSTPLAALTDTTSTSGNSTTVRLDPAATNISGAAPGWDGFYERDRAGRRLRHIPAEEPGGPAFWLETRATMSRHVYSPSSTSTNIFLLSRIEDRNGNALAVRRDALGRLGELQDAAGRKIQFHYDPGGELCRRITVPGGAVITLDYDGTGRLARVADLLGNQTTYEYDDQNYMTRMTSAGRAWTFVWQGETIRYLAEVRDPSGLATRYEIAVGDWRYRRLRRIDASGRSFIYEYPMDSYAGSEQPGETEMEYDASGRLARVTAPNRSRRTFQYGPNGLPSQVEDFKGGVNRWTYNDMGLPLTFTDAGGGETTFAYDSRGNLVRRVSPGGRVREFSHNQLGQLVAETRGELTTLFGYNQFGNLAWVRNPSGGETRYTYDAQGVNLIAVRNARGFTRIYEYDANQRLTRITFPDGSYEERTYDCCAQTGLRDRNGHWRRLTRTPDLAVLTDTDFEGHAITNHYDSAGRPLRREDAAGNFMAYTYNPRGQPETISNPLGDEAVMTYDHLDELLHMSFSKQRFGASDAEGAGAWWLGFDAMGHLAADNGRYFNRDRLFRWSNTINRRGSTYGVRRDPDGWVVATLLESRTNAIFTYTAAGFLASHTHALGTETYQSDARGLFTNIVFAAGHRVSREFDEVGNVTQITYPGGSTAYYEYDSLDRPTNVVWNGISLQLGYDAAGNRILEDRSNGCETRYVCNANGLMTNISHSGPSGLLVALECARDSRGLTISRRKTGGVLPWQPALSSATIKASYNPDSSLASWNGQSCSSDADANQTRVAGSREFTATYTANNLLETWIANSITNRAIYDGLDRLVEWRNGASVHCFGYDELNRLLFECDDRGRVLAEYLYVGRQPVAMRYPQGAAFFHLDLSGNTAFLTDQAGRVAALYQYMPYGQAAGSFSRAPNPFTFAGGQGVYDLGNGLHLMRHRVYDSTTRAFLTRDPLGHGPDLNPRRYAMNSPVDMADPLGLSSGIAGGTPQLDYRVGPSGDNCVITVVDKTVGLSKWGPFASIGKIGYALWEHDWDTAAGETGMAVVGAFGATAGLLADFVLTPSNAYAIGQGETEEDRIRICLEYNKKHGISYNMLDSRESESIPDYSTDRHLEYISESYGSDDE